MDILRQLIRIPGVQGFWVRHPMGSVPDRVRFGIWDRPHYAFGVNFAAKLAQQLGLSAISVIEFGVAGRRGLLALEHIADLIGRYYGIKIKVFGSDAAVGLPKPVDYRDLPHVWATGDYVMDVEALRSRLKFAELVLGDVNDTILVFLENEGTPPIGFVGFDLDYYSSTAAALKIFDGAADSCLPRVCCYFDDIVWPEEACHNDFVGEYLAINEYNQQHDSRKIYKLRNLRWMQPPAAEWHEEIFIHHDFTHPLYTKRLRGSEQLSI